MAIDSQTLSTRGNIKVKNHSTQNFLDLKARSRVLIHEWTLQREFSFNGAGHPEMGSIIISMFLISGNNINAEIKHFSVCKKMLLEILVLILKYLTLHF